MNTDYNILTAKLGDDQDYRLFVVILAINTRKMHLLREMNHNYKLHY